MKSEKPAPTISSILDDLLYTLPFDWLDDSQNTENAESLFDPTPKEPAVTPEQPKEPQIIPIVPKEVVLLVPQEPVEAPPVVVERQVPVPVPVPMPVPEVSAPAKESPAPVYEEPQPEPIERPIDTAQKRQNIFVVTPPKPQPKKSIWERIGDAAVNMFYFEPVI